MLWNKIYDWPACRSFKREPTPYPSNLSYTFNTCSHESPWGERKKYRNPVQFVAHNWNKRCIFSNNPFCITQHNASRQPTAAIRCALRSELLRQWAAAAWVLFMPICTNVPFKQVLAAPSACVCEFVREKE